jgi:hypothetical protein
LKGEKCEVNSFRCRKRSWACEQDGSINGTMPASPMAGVDFKGMANRFRIIIIIVILVGPGFKLKVSCLQSR